MESKIGWLSNSSENSLPYSDRIITDTSGEVVELTSEQLQQIAEMDSTEQLMSWGGFRNIEEADNFIATQSEPIS